MSEEKNPQEIIEISGISSGATAVLYQLLSPSAKVFGERIGGLSEVACDNIESVLRKVANKISDDSVGTIPLRVGKSILQEVPYSDNEITQEYFAGVLATSKTQDNIDDRGVYFNDLVSKLSSYQLRAHFIFYSLVNEKFLNSDLNVQVGKQANDMGIVMSSNEFLDTMNVSESMSETISGHIFSGLSKEDLITGAAYGHSDKLNISKVSKIKNNEELESHILKYTPTSLGAELFLWSIGRGDLPAYKFLDIDNTENLSEIEFNMPQSAKILKEL